MFFKSRLLAGSCVALLLASLSGCGGGGTTSADQNGAGTATLHWTPPSSNEDGSPASLSGYNVYVGSSQNDMHPVVNVGAAVTTYIANGLPSGTVYFAITAIGINGRESGYSGITTVNIN
jgi:hypothetical protein